MFDFQKLSVYQKTKDFNKEISALTESKNFEATARDQLRRASLNIMLNIAEGFSRFSNNDRKHFMVISRGNAFECVAILDYLKDNKKIDEFTYLDFFQKLEEISKMLSALIKKLES
ncbi:MAG: four helix bundle protein [Bacteroidota bacterium]